MCIKVLEEWLAGQPEGDARAAQVRKHVNAYLVPLCTHFSCANRYMNSCDFARDDCAMEEGARACREVVRLWRELAKPGEGNNASVFKRVFNKGWTVKLKHHLLEAHVVPFIERHGCAGAFSESAVESFHRLWNTMERTWVSISKAQDRWRIMVDRAAVNAENGAKESGAKARKEALNGKTRRGL